MSEEETTRELTEPELCWIKSRASAAEDLVSFLLNRQRSVPLDPPQLDEAFQAWRRIPNTAEVTPKDVVDCLGCAFGEYLVARRGCAWLVVSDSFGTDLAVRKAGTDVTTFPLAVVAKRLDSPPEELSFFLPIARSLEDFPKPFIPGGA